MSRGCNRNRERSFSSPAHPVGLKPHMAQVGTRPRRTVEEQELLDVLARLEGRELTGSIVNRDRDDWASRSFRRLKS